MFPRNKAAESMLTAIDPIQNRRMWARLYAPFQGGLATNMSEDVHRDIVLNCELLLQRDLSRMAWEAGRTRRSLEQALSTYLGVYS